MLGLFTFAAVNFEWGLATSELGLVAIFLVLNIMHGGLRLGRKIYLVDMASGDNRATDVAVSNTLIGVLMLVGGLIGLVGDWLGSAATVLVLGLLSLVAAGYSLKLPEVSERSRARSRMGESKVGMRPDMDAVLTLVTSMKSL